MVTVVLLASLLLSAPQNNCISKKHPIHKDHVGRKSMPYITESPNKDFKLMPTDILIRVENVEQCCVYGDTTFMVLFGAAKLYIKNKSGIFEMSSPLFSENRFKKNLAINKKGYFVFDQMSNPHYGLHFEYDIDNMKLIIAAPFRN